MRAGRCRRSPVRLAGGGDEGIETAGFDYVLPYWMAGITA